MDGRRFGHRSPGMVNIINGKHIPGCLCEDFTLAVQNSHTHHADCTILPKTRRKENNNRNNCAGDRRDNPEEKGTHLLGAVSQKNWANIKVIDTLHDAKK